MKRKKISVIIPVYNCENYISDCINSVIKQSYKNIEIILVNDGSSDNSENIINSFSKNDKRIKYFSKNNAGVSSARNYGIEHSTGDFIIFIDADDFIEEDYIANLIKNNEEFDFAMMGYKIWDSSNNRYITNNCKPFSGNIYAFMKNIFNYIHSPILLGPCFKLFKRKIIIDNNILFPEDISFGEDAEFVFNYLKYISKVRCINKTEYVYRKAGNNSLSSKFIENKMDLYYRVNKNIKNLFKEKDLYSNNIKLELEQILLNNFISYCHELFSNSEKYIYNKKLFLYYYNKYNINNIIKRIEKKNISCKTNLFCI